MDLVVPIDEIGAGLAPGPVAPLVVEVVLVPFVAAVEVFKKRCLADRYLFTCEADKPFDAVEDLIHRFPHPRLSGLRIPCWVVLQPYSFTRARISRRSIAVTLPAVDERKASSGQASLLLTQ